MAWAEGHLTVNLHLDTAHKVQNLTNILHPTNATTLCLLRYTHNNQSNLTLLMGPGHSHQAEEGSRRMENAASLQREVCDLHLLHLTCPSYRERNQQKWT